jgi:hypothetical protein
LGEERARKEGRRVFENEILHPPAAAQAHSQVSLSGSRWIRVDPP